MRQLLLYTLVIVCGYWSWGCASPLPPAEKTANEASVEGGVSDSGTQERVTEPSQRDGGPQDQSQPEPKNEGEPERRGPEQSTRTTSIPLPKQGRWKGLPDALIVRPIRADIQRGLCYANSHQGGGVKGLGTDASLDSKKIIKANGGRWYSVTRFGWMSSDRSTEVRLGRYRPQSTEDKMIENEVKHARQLGLKIMLKPHIWVSGNGWRGDLKPENNNWKAWFASYQSFILHYARLAQRFKMDAFVIGVELKTTSGQAHKAAWEALIAKIRHVYTGKITYGANWDEYDKVSFWDKLDWIGIQFFAPLTNKETPTYEELAAGVAKHLKDYERISKKHNKAIIFTEAGYRSTISSFIKPYVWPEQLPPEQRAYSEVSQAVAYAAFFNTAGQSPHVKGIYIWKWFSNVGTDEDGKIGFSPYNKLALKVMKAAYQQP